MMRKYCCWRIAVTAIGLPAPSQHYTSLMRPPLYDYHCCQKIGSLSVSAN
jgi:hypothetical protein